MTVLENKDLSFQIQHYLSSKYWWPCNSPVATHCLIYDQTQFHMVKGIDNAFDHMELCFLLSEEKFQGKGGVLPKNYFHNRIPRWQLFATNNLNRYRGDQIFFSATCPGQVSSKNPLVLMNFLLVPKYFSNCISFGQVANTTISNSKCNSNQSCR